MRRLARHLFTLCSAVSLVVCIATCVAWASRLDRRASHDGWLAFGNRYNVAFSPAGMALLGPPHSSSDPQERQSIVRLTRELRDANLRFDGYTNPNHGLDLRYGVPGVGISAHPLAVNDEAACGLLAALEDRHRFVAAHLLLSQIPVTHRLQNSTDIIGQWRVRQHFVANLTDGYAEGRWSSTYDNLSVTLVEDTPRTGGGSWGQNMSGVVTAPASEMPKLREQWHRRLDVPIIRISYAAAAALLLVFPVANAATFVARTWLRRGRRLAGRCASCGYDVRASPERCPECGTLSRRTAV